MKSTSKRTHLTVETLEDRRLMTVYLDTYGNMTIHGTTGKDVVNITEFTGFDGVKYVQVQENGFFWSPYVRTSVRHIRAHLYGGSDVFTNGTSVRSEVSAGAGNDTLWGGSNVDVFYGGVGDDWMNGGAAGDYLYGGWGVDEIWGGAGKDVLDGGDDYSRDYLVGGSGYDYFQSDWEWTGTKWVRRDITDYVRGSDAYYNNS